MNTELAGCEWGNGGMERKMEATTFLGTPIGVRSSSPY